MGQPPDDKILAYLMGGEDQGHLFALPYRTRRLRILEDKYGLDPSKWSTQQIAENDRGPIGLLESDLRAEAVKYYNEMRYKKSVAKIQRELTRKAFEGAPAALLPIGGAVRSWASSTVISGTRIGQLGRAIVTGQEFGPMADDLASIDQQSKQAIAKLVGEKGWNKEAFHVVTGAIGERAAHRLRS